MRPDDGKGVLKLRKACSETPCSMSYPTGIYKLSKIYTQFRSNYPKLMKLGGKDDENIIAELIEHTEVLFDDQ